MAGGILYLVATPIGNLGDVTYRAVEILRSVPLIAAEDTRVTRRLLSRYDVHVRLTSYHARSDPSRSVELLRHLAAGADLALVTDAGTPGISDPGAELAAAWWEQGGRVEAIPGASAVMVGVAVSGLAGPRWSFEGFLPRSGRERRERLARIAAEERGAVIFEAPRRLGATINDLLAACGPERNAAICRELTKLHEQVVRGSLADLQAAVAEGAIPELGEALIVLGSVHRDDRSRSGMFDAESTTADVADAVALGLDRVEEMVGRGLARGDAARRVAAETGLTRRQLYRVREQE